MKTLSVSLDFAVDVPFEIKDEEVQKTLKKLFVLHLFKTGRISSGKAAEMLGITKYEMLEIIYSEGIPYFDYDEGEIRKEFEALRELGKEDA